MVVSPRSVEPAFGAASSMSGTSLRSKVARIGPTAPGSTVFSTSTILKNPGPGEYQVASDWDRRGPKQLVGTLRPVAEVASRAPSMPPVRLLPGQRPPGREDIADVSLAQARYRGDLADMAGPGDYDLPAMVAFDQIDRLGPRIGGGAARAQQPWESPGARSSDFEAPGPGSYETGLRRNARMLQPDANFSSGTVLAHQKEVAVDRIGPGPGQYSPQGELEKSLKQAQARGANADNRFSSTSARVGWNRDVSQPYKDPWNASHVPGPGSYGEPKASAIASPRKSDWDKEKLTNGGKKKVHGVHHPAALQYLAEQQEAPRHGFHATDDRPCMKPSAHSPPSPAQYEIDRARGTSMVSMLREKGKVGRKGVFGTCQDRFKGSALSPHVETAAVAWATPRSSIEEAVETKSSMRSTVKRFETPAGPREAHVKRLGVTDTPAPGAYNTTEPTYRSPFRQPKQDHISFGSSDQRFSAANFGQMPKVSADPGQYEPNYDSVKSRVKGGGRHASSRRAPTVGSTTESVGPGSYGDSTGETSSLIKKSHNVTREGTNPMPKSARASTGTRR
ncbi:unnamed protein product [Prorocentrum cordatum]|uniref:Uncharacterized protein n=1 Tax=Prorocentrum cordatum TaxID=2364126 RepID=A0ABN9R9Z6_9DINO|nr:unnamed protein product [Polarella glacialis]